MLKAVRSLSTSTASSTAPPTIHTIVTKASSDAFSVASNSGFTTTNSISGSSSSGTVTSSACSIDDSALFSCPGARQSTLISHDDIDAIDVVYQYFVGDKHIQGILAELDMQERDRLISEFVADERQYAYNIKTALEQYKRPLMSHNSSRRSSASSAATSTSSSHRRNNHLLTTANKPPASVPYHDVDAVFGNLEDLLMLSQRLLGGICERLRIWNNAQLLSDILRPSIASISSAYTVYYENFGDAMGTLERLLTVPSTKKCIESLVDTAHHPMSSLASLLGLPLLAVKRYTQFFKELVLLTDPHHPDAIRLNQCAAQLAQFHSSSHRLHHRCHNVSNLIDMTLSIRQCPPMLDTPRSFIMRGPLTHVSHGNKHERRMYFLLSDMLLFARSARDDPHSLHYKGRIDLHEAVLRPAPKKKRGAVEPFTFEISLSSNDSTNNNDEGGMLGDIDALLAAAGGATAETYLIRADSQEAMDMWMTELQRVIDRLRYNPIRNRK